MLIRTLPLTAGIAPFLAAWLAYWLGVHNGVLPTCIPFLDGCTSISATGRTMPGSLLFRAVMLPQAIVLTFVWYFSARWLQSLAPSSKAVSAIIWSGLVGSASLVLYVTFLGTKAPFYEFMRRFGIYFYFLGTAVAQLTLAIALLNYLKRNAMPSLKRLPLVMLWLVGLPFAL
ncbi:MAG: hypothetical protein KJP16_10685 [Gammaproteobacteria bacterium]|nr:hypothetical protein [Gammaproteobacteria bacterium]NNL51274.1 hypothetical protein [Woeseiaceae bacterium]